MNNYEQVKNTLEYFQNLKSFYTLAGVNCDWVNNQLNTALLLLDRM